MRVRHCDRPWEDGAMPDEALAERAQRGQGEAFGAIWDRHHASIYGYCFPRLGDREAAQDATGETFRKALAALPTYQARAFRGWLFAIAHNVVVDELRARRPALPLAAANGVHDTAPTPEDAAGAAADLETVTALLPRLSADQRDAVVLRLAGLGPVEIATALGKSRAAVDMTLLRAVVRLRALMGIDPSLTERGEHND